MVLLFRCRIWIIETLVCKIMEIYTYLRKDPFTIRKLMYGVLLMWIGRDRCCWSIRFLSSSGLGDFLPIVWTPPFFFSRNHRKPGLCMSGFEPGSGTFVINYAKHNAAVVRDRTVGKFAVEYRYITNRTGIVVSSNYVVTTMHIKHMVIWLATHHFFPIVFFVIL